MSTPLSLPPNVGIASIEIRADVAAPFTRSPFTGRQQVGAITGRRWRATVSLPPLNRADAAPWTAFLTALNGPAGTFLLGDPRGACARGTVKDFVGTLTVNGADQTGQALQIAGGPTSESGFFLAGDYIQLGSGATATLYKVLQDAATDGSGAAELTLWPGIRTAPANGSTVVTANPVGRFRLPNAEQGWNIANNLRYGVSFEAVEAI